MIKKIDTNSRIKQEFYQNLKREDEESLAQVSLSFFLSSHSFSDSYSLYSYEQKLKEKKPFNSNVKKMQFIVAGKYYNLMQRINELKMKKV